jgi:hypothetical protein
MTLADQIRRAIMTYPDFPADPGFAFATALAGDMPDKLAGFIASRVEAEVSRLQGLVREALCEAEWDPTQIGQWLHDHDVPDLDDM